jgi:phosphoribosylanthranilate isomerase
LVVRGGVGVKICGLTRVEDALLAASLGAWALGFVFAESPRRVSPSDAAMVVREVRTAYPGRAFLGGLGLPLGPKVGGDRPRLVGVFRDTKPEDVAGAVERAGLDSVQLHGGETPEEVLHLRRLLEGAVEGPVLVIKALGVEADGGACQGMGLPGGRTESGDESESAADELVARAASFQGVADLLLLDTAVAGRSGGTGRSFRWELARPVARHALVLVAGGITPENAAEAIRRSGAGGIDVSSGVERSPGVKDEQSLRLLFAELRRND